MNRYVALLRGINVGGNNLIKMTDLKACFEKLSFSDVTTYIQSGNVLFSTNETDQPKLTKLLEDALAKTFHYKASVVLFSIKQMDVVANKAPKGFGKDPTMYRYDVLFLKEPLTAAEAMKHFPLKEGVDQAYGGNGVVYFSRLVSKLTQSRISRIASLPVYKQMTIRNWNTTTKLCELLLQQDLQQKES